MLVIENLQKTYANGVKALDGVTLSIPKGLFGLLGPNGAGKSSLMRTIATLQGVDSGSVYFDGIDLLNSPTEIRYRSVTTSEQKFINNLFEQITLYDLKLLNIDSSPAASGIFDITLNIEAQFLKADGEGQEIRLSLADYVDLGLRMKHPDELLGENDLFYLGRHKIVSGDNRISINVLENPKYALIDPYVRLIDKELENNYQAF